MKKEYVIGLIVVVLLGVGAYYAMTNQNKTSTTSSNSSSSTQAEFSPNVKKACEVFTEADAAQLLGSVGTDDKQMPPTENETVSVSTCTYMENTDNMAVSAIKNAKQASLLVRAAKSSEQASANKATFGSNKPSGAEDVSGYGDKAFWDSTNKQLNVLKGNNWYILSGGTASGTNNTLDDAKKLADLIQSKF